MCVCVYVCVCVCVFVCSRHFGSSYVWSVIHPQVERSDSTRCYPVQILLSSPGSCRWMMAFQIGESQSRMLQHTLLPIAIPLLAHMTLHAVPKLCVSIHNITISALSVHPDVISVLLSSPHSQGFGIVLYQESHYGQYVLSVTSLSVCP
jgi:hypothetical protein